MAWNPDRDCFRASRFALIIFLCANAHAQVHLNQIQVIGSHNSYHAGLAPSETVWLGKLNPKSAAALDYRHPALDVQLSNGVRQVEIDIYASNFKSSRKSLRRRCSMLSTRRFAPFLARAR